jgi:D-alanyl-lipoteichoic acid acyltransferase DltB (MBOAT superfamily)
MDSASFQFVLFGLAVAIVSNLSRSRVWRSTVLLLASLVFLGLLSQNPLAFIPLAGFLLLGYIGCLLLHRGWSKALVWSVLAVILVYAWLKKYTFLPPGAFLNFPYFTLGLSYIFFRVLHLLIESGEGLADEKKWIGIGAYLLYTLNFTTFVSGPIQRYDEFARDQFAAEPIKLGIRTVGLQFERIVRGFFKVNVLAMLLHMVQEKALEQLSQPLPMSAKVCPAFRLAVIYPFFLYANFSGYIDIVIALARLMRVRLPENFDRPFSASSFLDFWNRWHITLSTWLKNYVYNPLLMTLMRRVSSVAMQPFLGVICFFVTFFLVGIWHGRTSEFVIFGVLQGGGVAINKLWQVWLSGRLGRKRYKALAANPIYIAFGRGLTFSWFAFTLFWFWANWKQIDTAFTSITAFEWLGVWLAIWLSATAVLALWEKLRSLLLSIQTSEGPVLTSRYARMVYASALVLAAFVVTVLLNQPAPGIVYKAF